MQGINIKKLSEELKGDLTEAIKNLKNTLYTLLKWLLLGVVTGIVVGLFAGIFARVLHFVNDYRGIHGTIKFLLPVAGLFIVFLYKICGQEKDGGTNTVISSIRNEGHVPLAMAPLIFIATAITHLFGGSAGREGAAIQIGGSLAFGLGKLFRLNENDKHLIVLCGMSAGFSGLFGTPMAAAFFALEVISVGILHYSALVPCITSALTARYISSLLGNEAEHYLVPVVPDFAPVDFPRMVLFGVAAAGVSVLLCLGLHKCGAVIKYSIKNPYLRIFVAGLIVLCLSFVPGWNVFLGSGAGIIEHIFAVGAVPIWYFIMKILFTGITLGGGFKGGEIVPTFTVGACFGSAAALIFGLPPELAAACGMVGVFCGVTNCPISSLLIAFELFGFQGMPYYLVTIGVAYLVSGYFGLYNSQKIIYSKTETRFIDRKTH